MSGAANEAVLKKRESGRPSSPAHNGKQALNRVRLLKERKTPDSLDALKCQRGKERQKGRISTTGKRTVGTEELEAAGRRQLVERAKGEAAEAASSGSAELERRHSCDSAAGGSLSPNVVRSSEDK